MREVMWAPVGAPGIELLCLGCDGAGVEAEGLVVGVANGRAFRLSYEVRCDARWRVREVRVTSLDGGGGLHLLADGAGGWTTGDGRPLPALGGCVDVDLAATPFTNTLPIRRLGLRPGESAEVAVAWIAVPELSVEAGRQCYARLEDREGAGRYRFEASPSERLPAGFVAELEVDGDGVVIDYPGLFRRVWSRGPVLAGAGGAAR